MQNAARLRIRSAQPLRCRGATIAELGISGNSSQPAFGGARNFRYTAPHYTQFKKYFSSGEQGMIGFQKYINLIFTLFIEGDNIVFSFAPLQKTNYL